MLPLEGITVVSLEQAVAAPFATRQLAGGAFTRPYPSGHARRAGAHDVPVPEVGEHSAAILAEVGY